jgi:hypothetical protein
MGRRHRSFTLLACLAFVYFALTGGAGAAESAGETEAGSGPAATVSFVDPAPLALDEKELKALAKPGAGLDLTVHNALRVGQPVTIKVIGDPKLLALLTPTSQTLNLARGSVESFELAVTLPDPEPKGVTYAGEILAYGASGGIARRELTIAYPPPPEKQEQAGENALSPKRPIDVTLRAINYLPSLLANLPALAFVLCAGLAFAAFLFWRWKWLDDRIKHLPVLLIALGVVLAVIAAVGIGRDGHWSPVSWHAISAQPIELAPTVPEGTRGTVSSEDGTIAQLIAEGQKLGPENLSGANEYKGKYDLGSGKDKPEAAAKVVIRDFWAWAVLALSLGLVIGIAMHRWFQQKRPAAKLQARIELIERAYEADLKGSSAESEAGPLEEIRMDKRMLDRKEEIEALFDASETAKATEKLLALGGYVDKFAVLRERRRELDNAVAGLEITPFEDVLSMKLDEAGGYQAACAFLGRQPDRPGLDSEESELKDRLDRAEELTELIEGTTLLVRRSIRHLQGAAELTSEGEQKKKLGEIETKLGKAARLALQARTLKAFEEAEKEFNEAVAELRPLATLLTKAVGIPTIPLAAGLVTPDLPLQQDTEQEVAAYSGAAPAEAAPAVPADVGFQALEADQAQPDIHVGDGVLLTIPVDGEEMQPFAGVKVDFGDGSSETFALPREGQPLIVRHRYEEGGYRPQVVARSVRGDVLIATEELPEIRPSTRKLPSQRRLEETDRVVDRAAFLLAVSSGLVALYFKDPSWGQPMDYLAAIVWGGVTGEGVKFAAALADRVWPVP